MVLQFLQERKGWLAGIWDWLVFGEGAEIGRRIRFHIRVAGKSEGKAQDFTDSINIIW